MPNRKDQPDQKACRTAYVLIAGVVWLARVLYFSVMQRFIAVCDGRCVNQLNEIRQSIFALTWGLRN